MLQLVREYENGKLGESILAFVLRGPYRCPPCLYSVFNFPIQFQAAPRC